MSLYETANGFISDDSATKSLRYYAEYDNVLRANNIEPKSILEVGVYKGESMKVFSKCFPEAKIVGIDLTLLDIDLSAYPNVEYIQCDQADKASLESILTTQFPHGIDVISEDASHIGALSALTFYACFPFLKSGGVYVIEDWGTGYWDHWPDGGRFQEYPLDFYNGYFPRRLHSHDFGMVGFVKSSVDRIAVEAIARNQWSDSARSTIPRTLPVNGPQIKSLSFVHGICFAVKV